ncbi:hypothetical protein FHR83_000435 [Actinoplanes campanulatus]|uniref:Cytosolic protein n=1 Tax=Actinoplanes campanulatus TaxID=113559 RepID=A0A7W5FC33_9ACTN|nr:DUF6282 family protein [Actinoplanes campanulatus]MBB3092801.1 hypothetical protein [Actinoplanes campanulatus]GGM99116.1 hypothetical protein GCM10010109_03630 [Actinoplanes campanulatus]GID34102.1 hypothetical protein Aca09nite_06080 [Actinoplanes campanulatus]
MTEPSAAARALVAGAYDTHVHVAPDVMDRRIDDLDLARRCREVGLAGFILKSHYVTTAERAAVVRKAVPGVDVLGAITLNGSMGGMNPAAVEIAGRLGARIVWMPTVDSRNQRTNTAGDLPGAKPAMWGALQADLHAQGIVPDIVEVLSPDGRVLEPVRRVLRVIARHDMVLATGHLAAAEIIAVVLAAREEGVRRIVVTHPEFTSQRLPVADQIRLASLGVLLERCFTTPHTGKVSWDDLIAAIRAVGPEYSLLSSDLGQPFNPPVEDGLALFADRLLGAGFTEAEIHTMAVVNSRFIAL